MNRPLIIGLTGSIGMGKTETARMFARLGVPVYDSDAAVHRLYEKGGAAVAEIGKEFPGSVADGAVDRAKLTAIVTAGKAAFKRLEEIVHPLVARDQMEFLQKQRGRGYGRARYSAAVRDRRRCAHGCGGRGRPHLPMFSAPVCSRAPA